MPPSLKIALLGTGLLGKAIAERLAAVGHKVVVFNRTRTKALPLEAQGIASSGPCPAPSY
jgi:3-hydroxyisobutyrate dehydrogenase-like beta-hydroxyacid dehydrogenase